ncbi:MAG: MMPL family transporter [Microbacteriaceae bacterium]|nr:MMPL family transporter [Microbacteriaceae bacterium]
MRRLTTFITARATSWIVLVVALLGTAALFAIGSGTTSESAPGPGLPDTAESVQVSELQTTLPSADTTSALLVFSRDGDSLTDDDLAAVGEAATDLSALARDGFVPPPTVSDDSTAAIVVVPLEIADDIDSQSARAAELREIANAPLPDGLTALLTGAEGFEVDLSAVFDGADFTLLLTTVIVVAILLIVTYRSPWLWIVPLVVIGTADGLAGIAAARVASLIGITLDASVTGILSVLVFGAGTNYALLLIARYRDELRLIADRRHAMEKALRGAGPAIIASGSTVVLSLLTLLFAELTGNRALGIACATGILVAMIFALIVLPPTLLLFGRGLFWPYVPKFGSEDRSARGVWARLGRFVSLRPVAVAIVGVLVLGGLALGVTQVQTGLAQTERFIQAPEAVQGQQVIADSFAAGSGSPTAVIVNTEYADETAEVAASIDGVDSATVGEGDGEIVQVDVVLSAAAETEDAFDAVRELRTELDSIEGADALVGGLDAQALDVSEATRADQNLVIPLILVLVLIVLMILLRAILAPVLLLATVVGSYFASLGASWLLFQTVFDFPALDTNVVLLSFLFLVALGVDYNIFLVTRANEEARVLGTRDGMIRALAATGGVITSAGILLAAVFAVLGVLPLITLTQIGIIVGVGVLLDTLLVRTVIVPALAFIAGDKFWWPRRLHPTAPGVGTADAGLARPDRSSEPSVR